MSTCWSNMVRKMNLICISLNRLILNFISYNFVGADCLETRSSQFQACPQVLIFSWVNPTILGKKWRLKGELLQLLYNSNNHYTKIIITHIDFFHLAMARER